MLGTLARRAVDAGFDVALVSIDKDFFQLVGDHVRVYDPREDGQWFDAAGVKEKFGVEPAQVVDVLALVGDTSDNVAGVPGIGKKGAIDLDLAVRQPRRACWHSADQLKPKQRETLTTHREDALRSQSLVTIRTDVPLDDRLRVAALRGASRERVLRALLAAGLPIADERVRAVGRHDHDGLLAGHDAGAAATR